MKSALRIAAQRSQYTVDLTEYRSCALLAVIIGHTQNLHFAVNGWFMQRRRTVPFKSERYAISLIGFRVHAGVRKITSYVMFVHEFICRI